MPLISVIIPTRDRETYLNDALTSLEKQTFRNVEAVIVNDGGDDLSHFIRKWENTLAIKLLNHDKSYGPATARNTAIKNSSGTYLAFLDDDDIYLPNHLSDAVTLLEKHACDFTYSGALLTSERTTTFPENTDGCIYINHNFTPDFLKVACYLPMSSIVCRNYKEQCDGFKENLLVCEDWEMWLHLCFNLNYRIVHIPNVSVIYHRVPELDNTTFNATVMVEGYKKFQGAWEEIITSYPSNTTLVKTYRDYMRAFHRHCLKFLGEGKRLAYFSYENFIEFLLHEFHEKRSMTDIDDTIKGFIVI